MRGRPKLLTAEAERAIADEASRRAQRLPAAERVCTKTLAVTSGLSVKYVANIISRRRREIEARINVNSQCSGAVAASTQSNELASVSG